MLSLVLGAAKEVAARRETFTARQMDAAMPAPHHVFPALRRLIAPVDALAIALQHPVHQKQGQDEEENFCQAFAPVKKSRKCAASTGLRRVPAAHDYVTAHAHRRSGETGTQKPVSGYRFSPA